jgi:hypothetical protein
MKWLDKLAENLDHFAGEAVRKKVMKGSEKLAPPSNPDEEAEWAKWVKIAMDRVDKLVDEEARKKVMINTCPHIYPEERIRKMRSQYRRLRNVDKLLEIMCNDTSYEGTSYYDHPVREGNVIYVSKVPFDPKAYEKATDKYEKQLAYCHCPLARRTKESISLTFCYCSGGWDKQLWEGILEKPVRVELIKSIFKGDDRCVHAIHIPAEFVKDNP